MSLAAKLTTQKPGRRPHESFLLPLAGAGGPQGRMREAIARFMGIIRGSCPRLGGLSLRDEAEVKGALVNPAKYPPHRLGALFGGRQTIFQSA